MARPIIAVLAGGIITFIWGFLSWSMFPWHQPVPFENEAEVIEVMKKNAPEHAVYAYPAWDHSEEYDAMTKHAEGPYIYTTFNPVGAEPNMAKHMVIGMVINMVGAAILVIMMQNSRTQSFPGRLSIALLAGLFLGVMTAAQPWNWLGLPGMHATGFLFDGIVPWTIAGAVIAKILPARPVAN